MLFSKCKMERFLWKDVFPTFSTSLLCINVLPFDNCRGFSFSSRNLVESSRLTIGRRNELANVHSHRSFFHLQLSNDHVEVANTEVHSRAPTCKEHLIDWPRYASASTFVIGSPSSFTFFGRSRAFCARRLHK